VSRATTVLALALLAWALYAEVLELGFLGWDAWPLVAAARITDFSDLAGTFTEELMDGRYTDGHFYRPLTNLSVALDHAMHGLSPSGYHLTDLALCVVNAVLLGALVPRLFGASFGLAATVASVLFLLHPVQLDVLPVLARRADALALCFTIATLLAWPSDGCPGRRVLAAICALAAVAAKESGLIAVPLVLMLSVMRAGAADRSKALRATWPVLLVTLLFLSVRTYVLGSTGWHGWPSLSLARELVEPYLGIVLYPRAPLEGASFSALVAITAIAIFLACSSVWRRPQTSSVSERVDIRTALLLIAVWLVLLHGVSSLAGRLHTWYALAYVAPITIVIGVLFDRGVLALRAKDAGLAGMCLTPAFAVAALQVGASELVRDDALWNQADVLTRNTISRLEQAVDDAAPGIPVPFEDVLLFLPDRDSRTGRGAAVLSDYSLQAWADLHRSERIVVYLSGNTPESWTKDTVLIACIPGPPPRDE